MELGGVLEMHQRPPNYEACKPSQIQSNWQTRVERRELSILHSSLVGAALLYLQIWKKSF